MKRREGNAKPRIGTTKMEPETGSIIGGIGRMKALKSKMAQILTTRGKQDNFCEKESGQQAREVERDKQGIQNSKRQSPTDATKISNHDAGLDAWPNGPYQSISLAAHLLDEVNDIRDELNILRSLLRQQKKVFDGLLRKPGNEYHLWSPDNALEEIDAMDEVAKRIQNSVSKHASIETSLNVVTRSGRPLIWSRPE